ncbi:MAG: ACP synthase [Gammaproteobacteria bacterium BRH_c0]|nr:MAG: ACP synthase [Gammaproteobacteria bacterium BRH_c0]
MICGIGTDMVKISRIESALDKRGERFAQRILSPTEFSHFQQAHSPACHLAKRFAAKEAVSKALGTGIGVISWHDIEVYNDGKGAPGVHFYGNAAQKMAQLGAARAWLSLSDEGDYALAFAVISAS